MIIDYSITPPVREFLIDLDYLEDYSRIYKDNQIELEELLEAPMEAFIAFLDKEGIDVAVIKARDIETTYRKKISNDVCADIVHRSPTRLIGLAGVDPFKGKAAIDELDYAIEELGLKGINIWPYEYNRYPHDKIYYPIYEKCQELKAIVSVEASMHFNRSIRMDLCRPLYIDYVAVDFPDLKIVCSTPGWPWVAELVAVAWRHPNVYIATSVVRPKYFGIPGTGYDILTHFGNSILQDRVIFGSGWPSLPIKRGIEEIRSLPLKDEVKEKWLGENASSLLDI